MEREINRGHVLTLTTTEKDTTVKHIIIKCQMKIIELN